MEMHVMSAHARSARGRLGSPDARINRAYVIESKRPVLLGISRVSVSLIPRKYSSWEMQLMYLGLLSRNRCFATRKIHIYQRTYVPEIIFVQFNI